MKECELIKRGHTFGLLAVSPKSDQHLFSPDNINTSLREKIMGTEKKKKDKQKENALIFYQILLTNSCIRAKVLHCTCK